MLCSWSNTCQGHRQFVYNMVNRAAGNIATEDLAYMLQRSGVETGLDLDKLIAATGGVQDVLGRQTPAMVSQAGDFPKAR